MKLRHDALPLLGIVVLSLIPLLWFRPGYLITGTDVDFPLFPLERLSERWFTWYPEVLGGADRSHNIASLVFVLPQTLLATLGLDLITIEKLLMVLWFLLVGLAFYALLCVLLPRRQPWVPQAKLLGTALYLVNFYQVFLWVRLQTGLFALMLFPLFLALFLAAVARRLSLAMAAALLALVGILTSPIGTQPPLVAILFALLTLTALWLTLRATIRRRWREVGRVWSTLGVLSAVYLGVSAFWLLPLLSFVAHAGYGAGETGSAAYAVEPLLVFTAPWTSFLNVFRLFGDFVLFDSWGGEYYMPEFRPYQTQPLLILGSFLLPLAVFAVLLLRPRRDDPPVGFFLLLALLGLFFSKGLHPPLGALYRWMVEHVPFFWIQRAPWQKFTALTLLAYAVVGGTVLGKLCHVLPRWSPQRTASTPPGRATVRPWGWAILFLGVLLTFNFVFVRGLMFPSAEGEVGYHQRFNLGFHQQFPEHLFEARAWIEGHREHFKILLLPSERAEIYRWGFAASGGLTPLLFQKGIISRQYGEGLTSAHPAEDIADIFTAALYAPLTDQAARLLRLLGVRYLLQRDDAWHDFYGDTDAPSFVHARLAFQRGLVPRRRIGPWTFYEVERRDPLVFVPQRVGRVDGTIDSLLSLASAATYDDRTAWTFLLEGGPLPAPRAPEALRLQAVPIPGGHARLSARPRDGRREPFVWEMSVDRGRPWLEARWYDGSKGVVSDTGSGDPDMFAFPSPEAVPYRMYNGATNWAAYNSTLLYLTTGEEPLLVSDVAEGGKRVTDIVGIWWETDSRGAGGTHLQFPLSLPPRQRVILQVNHRIRDEVAAEFLHPVELPAAGGEISHPPTVTFQRLNPTRYAVRIAGARRPFPLVLQENFHAGWRASLGARRAPLPADAHFPANGSQNAWWIDPAVLCTRPEHCVRAADGTASLDLRLDFVPQRLLYASLLISGITTAGTIGIAIVRRARRRPLPPLLP